MAIKSEEWGSSLLGSAISSDFLSRSSAAPRSVPAPSRVRSINGSSVQVAWDEPGEVRGVMEKYILRACPQGGVPGPPRTPCATSELVHTGNLTGRGVPAGVNLTHWLFVCFLSESILEGSSSSKCINHPSVCAWLTTSTSLADVAQWWSVHF